MSKLKPCPFCGHKEMRFDVSEDQDLCLYKLEIVCDSIHCSASGPPIMVYNCISTEIARNTHEKDVWAAWNKRVKLQ